MDNLTEPDWMVDRICERGTVMSIFGSPKSGKSFLAIAMACAVSSGKDFYGFNTKPSTVLYLAGEGFIGVGRRVKAYEEFYNISISDNTLLVSNRGSRIGDDEEFSMLQNVCRDIEADNNGIGMIIIDTLARNYGLNENSTEDMNKFIQRVDELKEEFNATIVIVHHTGHGSNGRARGSSVLPAALDYEFRVDRDKNSDDKAMLVTVKQTLVKDGTPIDDLYFQFKEQTLYGYQGVTSGVLAITDESPKKLGLTRAREETIKAIEDYQKEKEPNDPVSVWVKFTVLKARMDISDSALKSRLADLKDMELVHYKEGYGYQAKSFDNEVF
jgi:KaiC/GvpD/RAD55 family RecA-like ATPase